MAKEIRRELTRQTKKRRTFLSLFTVALLLNACGKSKKLPFIPAGKAVLAFGDSVTFGTGATPGEDWPTLLARQTGWLIENAGIPGDTAEAGKRRFASLLELHKPTLVIIEIGGNDFLRRRAPKAVKEDLRDMIRVLPQTHPSKGIRVRAADLSRLADEVARLRAAGEVVVVDYLGETAADLHCDRELVCREEGQSLEAAPAHP